MSNGNLEPTRERLRAWAKRPPKRTAAVARTRVLARLGHRRQLPRFLLAATASAVLCLAIAVVLVAPHWPSGAEDAVPVARSGGLHNPMLVYELSSGTTLYFTLASPPGTVRDEPGNGGGKEL